MASVLSTTTVATRVTGTTFASVRRMLFSCVQITQRTSRPSRTPSISEPIPGRRSLVTAAASAYSWTPQRQSVHQLNRHLIHKTQQSFPRTRTEAATNPKDSRRQSSGGKGCKTQRLRMLSGVSLRKSHE